MLRIFLITFVVLKFLIKTITDPPKYFYVDERLGWKDSQKYCKEKFNGNLATHGLETAAGRM